MDFTKIFSALLYCLNSFFDHVSRAVQSDFSQPVKEITGVFPLYTAETPDDLSHSIISVLLIDPIK